MLFLKSVSTQVPFLTSVFMPASLSLPKTLVAKRTTPITATTNSAPIPPSTRRPPNDVRRLLPGLYPGGVRRPDAAFRSWLRRVASSLRLLTDTQHRARPCATPVLPRRASVRELDRTGEELLDLLDRMYVRHGRERRQQRLGVARGVEPAVEHGHHAAVVVRAQEPAEALAQHQRRLRQRIVVE